MALIHLKDSARRGATELGFHTVQKVFHVRNDRHASKLAILRRRLGIALNDDFPALPIHVFPIDLGSLRVNPHSAIRQKLDQIAHPAAIAATPGTDVGNKFPEL